VYLYLMKLFIRITSCVGNLDGWLSFAVNGFWVLWDNIYGCVFVITVATEMIVRDFEIYAFCLYVGWLVSICY
jgi:hypothetical protein